MGLDEDRAVVRKIRTLLKAHPKGLIITEIAQRLKVNRNSAAKYLEILLVTRTGRDPPDRHGQGLFPLAARAHRSYAELSRRLHPRPR